MRTKRTGGGEPLWHTTVVLVVVGLVGVATGLGFAHQQHGSVKLLGEALAVVLGAGLALIAARRFEAFLVTLFAIRPVLDAVKGGYSSTFTPSIAVGLVFLVAAVLWLWALRRAGRLLRPCAANLGAVALVATATLSVFASTSVSVSFQAALKLASGLVMFLVLEQITREDPRTLRSLFVATCYVAIFSSLIAIIEGVLRSSPDGRIRGVFVHENVLAEFSVTVALLLLALRRHLPGGLRRLATLTFVLALPAIYLTYTRGAWIGFVLGILVIGLLQDKRIVVGGLIAVIVAIVLVPGVSGRFSNLQDKRVQGAGDPNSFAFRERYWGEIAPLANATPIIGIGLDMVEHSTPEQLLPHNTPLQVYVEMGIAGSVAFLWLCGGVVVGLRRSVHALPRGPARGWAVGGIAAASAFGLEMLTDNLLLQALQLWYLALAVAPAIALRAANGSPFDDPPAEPGQPPAVVPGNVPRSDRTTPASV